ncbi:MAG: PilN domain-containing protein [Clostridiales bacterium]|jgi:Tfp pilus assembly protein PilN|nr:PilN domain-containing protein [Clostridiales bacterium]
MIRINLLKPEAKEIKEGPPLPGPEVREKKAFPFTTLVVLLIIGVLAAAFVLQKRMISQERNGLEAAQAEKSKLQYVTAKLEELEKQKALFERKINLISELKAQQDTAVKIMDELSRRLPEWVWLTEVSFQGQLIQMRGNALSNNLIADYIFNLQNCPHFANVNLISSTQKSSRNTQFLEFSLTLNYLFPQAAQPQEKAAKPKAKKG